MNIAKTLENFFKQIDFEIPSTEDSFEIKYANGLLKVLVTNKNGLKHERYFLTDLNFKSIRPIDFSNIEKDKRKLYITKLKKLGEKETKISELLKLSQSAINKIFNH